MECPVIAFYMMWWHCMLQKLTFSGLKGLRLTDAQDMPWHADQGQSYGLCRQSQAAQPANNAVASGKDHLMVNKVVGILC